MTDLLGLTDHHRMELVVGVSHPYKSQGRDAQTLHLHRLHTAGCICVVTKNFKFLSSELFHLEGSPFQRILEIFLVF